MYKEYLDKGIFNFQDGKYKEAIENLDESIKLKNDFPISYFYRGACYQALEDWDNAMLDYTESIKLKEDMIDAYYNRAQIILTRKDIDCPKIENAIEDLKKAIELDDKFQDAYFALGAAYKKQEKYEEAVSILDKLLEFAPDAIHGKALKKLILTKYLKKS